jgi:hypothetical protein
VTELPTEFDKAFDFRRYKDDIVSDQRLIGAVGFHHKDTWYHYNTITDTGYVEKGDLTLITSESVLDRLRALYCAWALTGEPPDSAC